jgi:4-hydroxybenzoate polyprenyltransferase
MNWFYLLRIYQWPKNFFVFGGLVFTAQMLVLESFLISLQTFLIFCLASSLVYIFNDIMDRESDRRHPYKKQRPIAAGSISPRQATFVLVAGLILLLVAVSLLLPVVMPVVLAYLLINLAYSAGLKRVIILDIVLVSSGFILRVLAGTTALDVPASDWILLCTGALALFLSAAKRVAELNSLESGTKTIPGYTSEILNQILTISASAAILTYGLYCSELNSTRPGGASMMLSLPFVLAGIFYYLSVLKNDPGRCVTVLLDRWLSLIVTGWLISVWITLV